MSERSLSDYIKHNRHYDGLGMGDQDLEQWADNLEKRIAELERENYRLKSELRRVIDNAHWIAKEGLDELLQFKTVVEGRKARQLEALSSPLLGEE